ncbi:hypothetical protein WA026_018394 [Henosepilachna vigintioctopunctata]|uniref:Major facilitator superfamily (MFS) profile domain-containing protein n=1 Tax=Henosepilachna vigintioctopunctata TaxID=420089 RepID=A0AAW1V4E0_9CUCU
MILRFCKENNGSVLNEYLATFTACILYFLVGVHTGWTSPYIPKLVKSEDYPFDISDEAASYIAIFGPIGDVFGEIASMLIVDRIGRKNTLLVLGTPMLASSLLIYFSNTSPSFIYIARFLGGITVGTIMSIFTMYTSEVARPSIRGKLGVIGVFVFIAGIITVNIVGKYLNFYQSSLIFIVIAVCFFISFYFMPESPYYLLMKNKHREAEKSLKFFRRTEVIEEELISLVKVIERQLSEKGNFRDLFSIDSNRKAVLLMVFGRILQQITGATAFTMYAQDLLSDSKDFIEPQFAVMVIFSIQTVIVLISGRLSDKFGRVPLIIISTASTSSTLFLFGVYFTLRDYTSVGLPTWIPFFLLLLFFIFFLIGIGSLLGVMLGEYFSASIKSKAICVSNITYSITVIFTTKLYQVCNDYIHISVSFYFFAVCTLIGTLFIRSCYPETKGKTLEEIQMELKHSNQNGTS